MKKNKTGRADLSDEDLCRSMEEDLELTESAGIPVFLNKNRESPEVVARTCMIRENGNYHCEYRFDENGKITELHFNKEEETDGKGESLPS